MIVGSFVALSGLSKKKFDGQVLCWNEKRLFFSGSFIFILLGIAHIDSFIGPPLSFLLLNVRIFQIMMKTRGDLSDPLTG